MRVSHSFPAISATFDDPNLVSWVGLAPTMALAQRAGLADPVSSTFDPEGRGWCERPLEDPRTRRWSGSARVLERAWCDPEQVNTYSVSDAVRSVGSRACIVDRRRPGSR